MFDHQNYIQGYLIRVFQGDVVLQHLQGPLKPLMKNP